MKHSEKDISFDEKLHLQDLPFSAGLCLFKKVSCPPHLYHYNENIVHNSFLLKTGGAENVQFFALIIDLLQL